MAHSLGSVIAYDILTSSEQVVKKKLEFQVNFLDQARRSIEISEGRNHKGDPYIYFRRFFEKNIWLKMFVFENFRKNIRETLMFSDNKKFQRKWQNLMKKLKNFEGKWDKN